MTGAEFPIPYRETTLKICARDVLTGSVVSIIRSPVKASSVMVATD